jgi:hypothetical protein
MAGTGNGAGTGGTDGKGYAARRPAGAGSNGAAAGGIIPAAGGDDASSVNGLFYQLILPEMRGV